MSAIVAIDPGTTQSAWVLILDGLVLDTEIEPNDAVLARLREGTGFSDDEDPDMVVIERIEPRYGLNMGWETIRTCEWVGRFAEAASPLPVELLRRSDILRHFDVAGAKGKADSGIRAALMDRYGGSDSIRKGGPLYGVKSHIWSALSVACAYQDGLRDTTEAVAA